MSKLRYPRVTTPPRSFNNVSWEPNEIKEAQSAVESQSHATAAPFSAISQRETISSRVSVRVANDKRYLYYESQAEVIFVYISSLWFRGGSSVQWMYQYSELLEREARW